MNLHQFRFVQEAARRILNLVTTLCCFPTWHPNQTIKFLQLVIVDMARHGFGNQGSC